MVEQAALHLLLVCLRLQMAGSRFCPFLVVHFPWRKGKWDRLVRVGGGTGGSSGIGSWMLAASTISS